MRSRSGTDCSLDADQIQYHLQAMDEVCRRRREVAELWLATMSLGAIVMLSALLHCCILDDDAHRGAPLCAKIAVAVAQPVGEHQTTTLPIPKQLQVSADSSAGEPLSVHGTTAERQFCYALIACAKRNVMTLGSMRIEDDVGLHDLNATYLI